MEGGGERGSTERWKMYRALQLQEELVRDNHCATLGRCCGPLPLLLLLVELSSCMSGLTTIKRRLLAKNGLTLSAASWLDQPPALGLGFG